MSDAITLERGAVLDHYIQMTMDIDGLRHSKSIDSSERAAALNSCTADLMAFRDQHDITIAELTSWTKRNVKRASSVSHAVQLLSGSTQP